MSVHSSPGRGRKYCKNCGKYVGVRSKVCENCHHTFEVKGPLKGFNPIKQQPKSPEKTFEETLAKDIAAELSEGSKDDVKTEVKMEPEVDVEPLTKPGSHVDRVNRLRDELIRELRQLSFGYGVSVLEEIKQAIKKYN